MMLYRYQVASDAFPTPSGDLIQVTPLMTTIATATTAATRENRDPFIRVFRPGSAASPQEPMFITLLDYQPAIRSASYAYVLVRFDAYGEIASVHPVPAIDVLF
jgi:hypothetical protein